MNLKINIAFVVLFSLSLYSCRIDEGEGGNVTIEGQVKHRVFYSSKVLGIKDSLISETFAIDEDVFIEYGDDKIYSDDFKTDYNGAYRFQELTKGNYVIYAYADCDSCAGEVSPVFIEVKAAKNSAQITAPIIYLDTHIE